MSKKIRFYCNRGSTGMMNLVRSLRSEGVDARRINRRNSRYGWYSSHVICNWGCSQLPSAASRCTVLNSTESVSIASNKVKAFQAMQDAGVSTVPWTTDAEVAKGWSRDDEVVYARTLINASEGRGIIVVHPGDEMPSAPLYTKLQEHDREVRLHVFDGKVVLVAEKKRLSSESRDDRGIEEEPNDYVRNTNGHWVFAVNGVEVTQESEEVAIEAIKATGLFFGSVDMLIKREENAIQSYVIETNSATGMDREGSTIRAYTEAFKSFLGY